jgi:hypothetical protein
VLQPTAAAINPAAMTCPLALLLAMTREITASSSKATPQPMKIALTLKVESRKKPETKVPTKLPREPSMLIVPAAAPTCVSFWVRL